MKAIKLTAFLIGSLFLINGCDFLKNDEAQKAKVTIYENSYLTKTYDSSKENSKLAVDLKLNNGYAKILNGLDGDKFNLIGDKLYFNSIPDYSNPQDENRDNIYEVKLYVVDEEGNDSIVIVKIEVIKSAANANSNNTNQNSDTNKTASTDSDNDFIPDNIEKAIGKDPTNSDENGDGIADGLEGDTFFDKEWHIRALGTVTNPSGVPSIIGNDLNLTSVYKEYMGYNNGNPVIVQIVDSGIDSKHEDLKDNMDLTRSLNGSETGDPTPGGIYRPHGTMLAGIAAARAFNNKGVRGVAPFAKIAGSNWLVKQSLDGLAAAWYSGNGANEIAVTNSSWGTYFTADTFYEDIMELGVKDLRDGKGRVYVFASGNAREENADSNIQYVINNRFTLVVSALNYKNKVANYSTPGANVWVAAYGGSDSFDNGPTIATTYISNESSETWDNDSGANYTYAMAGTSAAAPMVTGAVALILEACPNLGYRDVKYIIAKTAKKVDKDNSSWLVNAANMHFSRDYGFGLIDTANAIKMCKNGYKNLPSQQWSGIKKEGNWTIENSKTLNMDIKKNLKVEWVEATIDLDAENASNYDIYLTSPSGTKILLLKNGTKIAPNFIPVANWMKGGFRFSASGFLDENSLGNWTLEIVNRGSGKAVLKSAEIKVYGYKRGAK